MSPANASLTGLRPGIAKQVVVVFSDGYSQQDPGAAAQRLRALPDVIVYTVGISTTYTVRVQLGSTLNLPSEFLCRTILRAKSTLEK
jgi:hypothetical protein